MPSNEEILESINKLEQGIVDTNKKIEQQEQKEQQESNSRSANDNTPLPTNPSELVGFAVNKLGKLGTPFLILAIVVGGYLWMQQVFSTINERDASIRQSLTETTKATLDTGKSVVENTAKLINLNAQLGEAGEQLLTLQRQAATESRNAATEKGKAEVATRLADIEKKKAEAEKQKAVKLREELVIKQGLLAVSQNNANKLSQDLNSKQLKLDEIQAKLDKEEATLVKERGELELAKNNVSQREGLLKNLEAERNARKTIISDLQRTEEKNMQELERLNKEHEELRSELSVLRPKYKAAELEIAALKDQRELFNSSLASAQATIKQLGDNTTILPDVPEIDLSFSEAVTQSPPQIDVIEDLLRRYVQEPESVNADEWWGIANERLVLKDLDDLLRTDLGYEMVLKFNTTDEKNSRIIYVPIKRIRSSQAVGVLYMETQANEDEWHVVGESPAQSFTFIRMVDVADYDRTQVAAVVEFIDYEQTKSVETILNFEPETYGSTSLSEVLKNLFEEEMNVVVNSTEVIFGGSEPKIDVLTMADATNRFPALMEKWSSEDYRVLVATDMRRRAIDFDANTLIPAGLFGTELVLRAALVQIMNAAVSGDTTKISPLLIEPITVKDLGRLAALALRGQLIIDKNPEIQVAGTKINYVSDSEIASVSAASATVFASITYPNSEADSEEIEFRFGRKSGDPQWRLIGFGAVAKAI